MPVDGEGILHASIINFHKYTVSNIISRIMLRHVNA